MKNVFTITAARLARLLVWLAFVASGIAVSADFDRRDSPVPVDEQGVGTASDEFSLIVVPQEDHLKLLLERFGENRAIVNATIEIHGADKKASVTEVGDGVYRANDAWLLEPGKKALALAITAEHARDVLVLVFDPALGGRSASRRDPKYAPRTEQNQ
jgi:hypothetical protein